MRLATRKLLDRSFTSFGMISILIMGLTLAVILIPIFTNGSKAFVFKATVEHRRLLLERFERGNSQKIADEIKKSQTAKQPIYAMIDSFESDCQEELNQLLPTLKTLAKRDDSDGRFVKRKLKRLSPDNSFSRNLKVINKLLIRLKNSDNADAITTEINSIEKVTKQIKSQTAALDELKDALADLLGPAPDSIQPALPRKQYGATRWDRALTRLNNVLYIEKWDYSGDGMGIKTFSPRADLFRDTKIEPLFAYLKNNIKEILQPRLTVYWGFLTDKPLDIHIFGGILPELVGTIYLTLGAILFAIPIGIITAIYFTEYARPGKTVSFLRTCISTLAGVPSIVFGMFGLAFFLNVCHLPKGVLAGSLTLSLLILPTIIRASEEAIRAVPHTYREAALGLGAGRWHTIATVIIPAALPGILTGSVISMGRAAGETAPIIFTAAASVAATLSLNPLNAWDKPTSALSWNLYNLCTEHEAASEIRHVQFGMAATLITVVLLLNLFAIILRARITRKLKG